MSTLSVANLVNVTQINLTNTVTVVNSISVGNSSVNTVVNSSAIVVGSNTLTVGTSAYFLASGNVGIGTSNPQYGKLQVNGKIYAGDTIQSGNSFILQGNGMVTTNSSNNLLFGINEIEKARLDTSGRILIGLTAPYGSSGEKLTVNGMVTVVSSGTSSGNAPLYVYNTDTTASNNQPFINFHDGSSIRGQLGCNYTDGALWLNGAFGIRFRHNSGEVARFDSGTLAINTIIPDTTKKMHIYAAGTVGATPQLLLESGTNGYGAGVTFQSRTSAGGTLVEMARVVADGDSSWNTTASTQDARLSFWTTYHGTSYERIRITSSGFVGIGNTAPGRPLVVSSSGATVGIINTDVSGGIISIDAPTSGLAQIDVAGANAFRINTNSAERMRIDSSGRVTMPYQPVFAAYGGSSQSWSGTAAYQVLQLNNQLVTNNSRGAGYSTSTYRFTAPVAGMYMFFGKITQSTAVGGPSLGLYVNGSYVMTEMTIDYGVSYMSSSGMWPYYMNAGDYAELRAINYNNVSMTLDLTRCNFVGWLLG